MSSWKKASKAGQRTHFERHQPAAREHLGLLEKKKDYRLRCKDRHEKQETLKLLHKRALNKNKDEFYHQMIRSKIQNDEHHEKNQPVDEDTKDQIALMQTQDIKYVTMKRTIEANKIKRLQSEMHMLDAANRTKNKHIFFVDDEEEAKNFDLCKHLETAPEFLDRKVNRPRLKDLEKLTIPDIDEKELVKLTEKRTNAYKELQKRIEREKELSVTQEKMLLKKVLRQKRLLKPKRIKPGTKDSAPIYEFPYERKR